jgi:hypothetical protein
MLSILTNNEKLKDPKNFANAFNISFQQLPKNDKYLVYRKKMVSIFKRFISWKFP